MSEANTERWVAVSRFGGRYEASTEGYVRHTAQHHKRVAASRKGSLRPDGYLILGIRYNDRNTSFLVHRIIAEAFLGPCPPSKEVNHKNGVRTDNRLCNLEYVTRQENVTHCRQVLGHDNKGVKHGLARFTDQDVLEIRRLRNQLQWPLLRVAERFNCSFQQVSAIALYKCWAHLP